MNFDLYDPLEVVTAFVFVALLAYTLNGCSIAAIHVFDEDNKTKVQYRLGD